MKISNDKFLKRVYKINPEVQKKIRVIKDGEIIFTHEQLDSLNGVAKNEIKHFNKMSSGILFWINKGVPLIKIYKDILEKFEVDAQQAKNDLIEFIEHLDGAGFIEIVSD